MALSSLISSDLLLSPISWEKLKEELEGIITTSIRAQLQENLEEKFLSPSETCSLFQPKLSKTTLAKWTRDGQLQEHRFGGRIYYKYGEVIQASKKLRRYVRA